MWVESYASSTKLGLRTVKTLFELLKIVRYDSSLEDFKQIFRNVKSEEWTDSRSIAPLSAA